MAEQAKLSTPLISKNVKDGIFKTKDIREAFRAHNRNLTSSMWVKYLAIFDEKDSLVQSHVLCKVCRKVLKSGIISGHGTSNLTRHSKQCVPQSEPQSQEKISGYQSVLSNPHKLLMLSACMAFIVLDLRPLYALDGDGIHELLKAFAVICLTYISNANDLTALSFFLPNRDTVMSHIVRNSSQIVNKLTALTAPIFNDSGWGGAFSVDIWTDDYKWHSYICVIAHFVDENFILHNRVIANELLADDRIKSGPYILEKVKNILNRIGVTNMDKVIFVSDRGSNILAAFRDHQHIACSLHFLNNCLQNVFKSGQPKKVLRLCQKSVRYIKKSGKTSLFSPALQSASTVRWNFAHYYVCVDVGRQ